MITTVIFDVDGTLVDTVDMHAEAWQRALKEYGKEVKFSAVRAQIGKGGDQLMPVFLSREELDEFGEYEPHVKIGSKLFQWRITKRLVRVRARRTSNSR